MYKRGLKRHHVTCAKCGYEWMAYTEKPVRCALCNNPNIDIPRNRIKATIGKVLKNECINES
jgi:predicted Zn-ribbon and HTH transcriptional regulator